MACRPLASRAGPSWESPTKAWRVAAFGARWNCAAIGLTISSYPLSTEGCPGTSTNDQGQTEVVFTPQNGTRYFAPNLYCSSNQLNIQIPNEHPVGQSVTMTVFLNGTASARSTTLSVVATDPAVFAAVFATGPKAGRLVTSGNPAVPGDAISLFGTGLGALVAPVADGAPTPSLSATVNGLVSVAFGSIAANVLHAGGARKFVGLDQVNFAMPSGVAAGSSSLILQIGDASSPPFTIAVAGK